MVDPSLITILEHINAARARGTPDLTLLKKYARDQSLMRRLDQADKRLVVYGSLAPGEANDDQLVNLSGHWQPVTVRGRLAARGWGERVGFPGITWDETADPIDAQLFTSGELPAHWMRLDAFEGAEYRRILIPAETRGKFIVANIYELASPLS